MEDYQNPYHGPFTAWKIEGFVACMRMALCKSKGASVWHFPFWYLSANAGTGLNNGCEGEAIRFLREALKLSRRNIRACFCDIEPKCLEQLRRNVQSIFGELPDDWDLKYYPMNNIKFLDEVSKRIYEEERNPNEALGLAVFDPPSGKAFPRLNVVQLARRFRKIDHVNHWNLSWQAMEDGCNQAGQKGHEHFLPPSEMIEQIPKDFWFVREPCRGNSGQQRFYTLYGNNWRESRNRFADFHSTKTFQGEYILRTYRRFGDPNQGLLFE